MKIAGYFGLSNLDMKYLYGQTELLTLSNLKIESDGTLFHGLTLVSEDALFGAAAEVGPLEAGKTYHIKVDSPAENFEFVLVGDRIVWVTNAWSHGHCSGFVHKADKNGNIKVTFLRHRKKAHELLAQLGKFKVRDSFDVQGQGGEFPEIAEPLRMSLKIKLSVEDAPADAKPSDFGSMTLPGIRRWMSPKIYDTVDNFAPAKRQVQPLPTPSYPTDHVSVMENHEVYLQPGAGISPAGTFESRAKLYSAFGIDTVGHNDDYVSILKRLREQGKFDSLKHVTFGLFGIPSFRMLDERQHAQMIASLDRVCEALPGVEIWMRPSEINTNGEWQVADRVPEYMADKAAQGREAYWTRRKFAEEYAKLMEYIRDRVKHPEQVHWIVQGDGFLPDGSDYYRDGFELVSGKCIHRTNVQMVAAAARGIARAFDKPIALAYDCWNAGYYCNCHPVEVEHIFRSYYWSGCDFVDYEAQFMGTEDGKNVLLNESGRAFYDWVNFTRVHPRRGKEVIRIGYMKGSDDLGVRPTSPGGSRNLIRDRILQHEHPALQDWNLTDLVFPEWGCYEATSHHRYLTGTPYGAADVVPWDASADKLKEFSLLVMIGKNRLTTANTENYTEFVRNGGTLVLSLEHLLNEDQYQAKYTTGFERLIGCRLGEDGIIEDLHFNRLVPSRPRFFNEVANITGKVVETLPNGKPYVIKTKLGKGAVYFYTTEYFTTCGRESIDRLLKKLLAQSQMIRLESDNGWIEQAIFARDGIAIISLMNHGRIKCPTGLGDDQGPLRTDVLVDLKLAGVEIDDPEVLSVDDKMKVSPVKFTAKGGEIRFHADIEKFSEFVIGPKGQAKKLFFS